MRRSVLAALALLGLFLLLLAITLWQCLSNPSIAFLSAEKPAEWIVYPTDPTLAIRASREQRVRFRTRFDVGSVPASASIRLRAFQDYTLWLNGERVCGTPATKGSWKRTVAHEGAAFLRAGQNILEAEVRQVVGPPAFWLVMTIDGVTVKTDSSWETRTGDGGWVPVRLAVEPMDHPLTRASPSVAEGWRRAWPTVLLWAGMASVVIVGVRWTARWSEGAVRQSAPGARIASSRRMEWALLGLIAVLWCGLCANNLYRMPPVVGYDGPGHVEYVTFLLAHRRLPLANEGWEMFQPPLHYVLSACVASIGEVLGWVDAPVMVPKMVSAAGGLALIVLVYFALRIVFPHSQRSRCAGLIVGAALPMNIYLSQYPTNEVTAAAFTTAALVLFLRILRDRTRSLGRHVVLGSVLGLAVLSKHTAVLAVGVVLVVMAGRLALDGRWPLRVGLSRMVATAVAALAVAGWNGYRNWSHFGNPLVGNWDRATGLAWWQDPGYRTSSYYLSFGRSLTKPFHSCLYSFADGIFSSVWGDGTWAGISGSLHPPWHYDLMAVGFSLAWIPTLFVAVGMIAALAAWIRHPGAIWAVLMGHALVVGYAILFMTLKLPYYGNVKGFFGLSSAACLCALAAWGFDAISRRVGRYAGVLWIPLLMWAVNAYASFFVWPLDAKAHWLLGEALARQGKSVRGIEHFRRAIHLDPNRMEAYAGLGKVLFKLRRYAEARQTWQDGIVHVPQSLDLLNALAWLMATCPDGRYRDGAKAALLAERACRLTAPPDAGALDTLAAAQAEQGDFSAAINTLEQAIRLAESAKREDLLERMRVRLDLYKAGTPYRESGW